MDYLVSVGYKVDSSGLNKANQDLKKMKTGMDDAGKSASVMGKNMAAAGAMAGMAVVAAAAAIAAAVRSSINDFDDLAKAAQRAGVSIESLSTLTPIADMAGTNGDSLAKTLQKISEEAANGGEKLKKMGIDIKDANGNLKSADTLLKEVATKFAGYAEGPEKTAAAMALLSKRLGPEMLPFLNQGGEAIAKLQQRYRDMGLEVDAVSGKSAEAFNDSVSEMGLLAKGFANDLTKELVPGLAALASNLVESGIEARKTGTGFVVGLSKVIKIIIGAGLMVKSFAQVVGIGFAAIVTTIVDVTKAFLSMGDGIATAFNAAKMAMTGDFGGAKDMLSAKIEEIQNGFASLPGKIAGNVRLAADMMGESFANTTAQIQLMNKTAAEVKLEAGGEGGGGGDGNTPPNLGGKDSKDAAKAIKDAAKSLADAVKVVKEFVDKFNAYVAEHGGRDKDGKFQGLQPRMRESALGASGYNHTQTNQALTEANDIIDTIKGLGGIVADASFEMVDGILKFKPLIELGEELKASLLRVGQPTEAEALAGLNNVASNEAAIKATEAMDEYWRSQEASIKNINTEIAIQEALQAKLMNGTLSTQEEINNALDVERVIQEAINVAKANGQPLDEDALALLTERISKLQDVQKETNKITKGIEESQQLINSLKDNLASSISDALMTGEMDFKSFLNNITKMILDSEIKKLFADLFSGGEGGGSMLMQAINAGMKLWGAYNGTTATGTSGGSSTKFNKYAANGAVFDGPNSYFANGAVFNRPTSFSMQNGRNGVMAEASPEAIMPLTRGPNGKLGVAAHGGGSSSVNNINLGDTTINVQSTKDSARDDRETAKAIDKMLEQKMAKWMAEQRRSGNSMSNAFAAKY